MIATLSIRTCLLAASTLTFIWLAGGCTETAQLDDRDGGGGPVPDECVGIDCNTGGYCTAPDGDPICTCGPGYHAVGDTLCASDDDPCATEGACVACSCERWENTTVDISDGSRPRWTFGGPGYRSVDVEFDGTDVIAILGQTQEIGDPVLTFMDIVRTNGTSVVPRLALGSSGVARFSAFAIGYGDGRFVATWADGDPSSIYVSLIASDGASVAGPTVIGTGGVTYGASALGDDIYVAYPTPELGSIVQRFDLSLAPVGAPIELDFDPVDVRRLGDAVSLIGFVSGDLGLTAHWTLIRDGVVAGTSELGLIANTGAPKATSSTDGNDAMVCFGDGSLFCRRMSPVDAQPRGPAFLVLPEGTAAWDLVSAGCGYQLLTGHQYSSGQNGSYRAYEIDATNTVTRWPMDRHYLQPTRAFAGFRSVDGEVVRVLKESTIVTSACGPALPATTCEEVTAAACVYACDAEMCPTDFSGCGHAAGGSGAGYSAENCAPVGCGIVDLPACMVALNGAQQCSGVGSFWQLPVDCAIAE